MLEFKASSGVGGERKNVAKKETKYFRNIVDCIEMLTRGDIWGVGQGKINENHDSGLIQLLWRT